MAYTREEAIIFLTDHMQKGSFDKIDSDYVGSIDLKDMLCEFGKDSTQGINYVKLSITGGSPKSFYVTREFKELSKLRKAAPDKKVAADQAAAAQAAAAKLVAEQEAAAQAAAAKLVAEQEAAAQAAAAKLVAEQEAAAQAPVQAAADQTVQNANTSLMVKGSPIDLSVIYAKYFATRFDIFGFLPSIQDRKIAEIDAAFDKFLNPTTSNKSLKTGLKVAAVAATVVGVALIGLAVASLFIPGLQFVAPVLAAFGAFTIYGGATVAATTVTVGAVAVAAAGTASLGAAAVFGIADALTDEVSPVKAKAAEVVAPVVVNEPTSKINPTFSQSVREFLAKFAPDYARDI